MWNWNWLTASHVIAGTSVVALIFAAWQIHRTRKLSQVQHLLQIDREFTGEALITYRTIVAKKRLAGEVEPVELYRILDFFEMIGLLVRHKYLDAHDIWSMYSHWLFNVQHEFGKVIDEYRSEDATYYAEYMRLLERIRKIERKEEGTLTPPTREEVDEFWREEAELLPGSPTPGRRKRKRKGKR